MQNNIVTTLRFDVMEGNNSPMRVAQWATREQVECYCARVGRVIVSERRIGLVLSEIIVAKAPGATS